MAKVKKALISVILVLLTVLLCVPFVACGEQAEGSDKTAVEGGKEVTPCGLYTDLQFSLNGENGQVKATVKNKFTLFPSTVTVTVELYRSNGFEESVADMTMVASNKVYDLDQGKTVTASASTEGKAGYWKARASYRIDNKDQREKISETVYFNANGLKTTASAPAIDDREYYVSDFLQDDAETVQLNISLPPLHPEGLWGSQVLVFFDNEDMNTARDIFGEIKLEPFDVNVLTPQEQLSYYGLGTGFSMFIKYDEEKYVHININNYLVDKLGANLFVSCGYTENENKIFKSFTAVISEEAKEALTELANNSFYERYGKAENN